MPIYEEEGRLTREELLDLSKRNQCKECGSRLDVFIDLDSGKAFLACTDWHRSHHEGIEREASRYEKEGLASLNIPTRREIMTQDYGEVKTRALDKYMGVVSLTKTQAKEILIAVFPEAPESEITRAMILCASYGLNPLMKHVFLIPFNKGKANETWATVIGIKAKRLLASRRGSYSYVDNTPRIMTEEEQRRIFGEVSKDKLMVITKVRDPATGAESPGYGSWPKDSEPYGTEKGNSKFNMAAIRSESQALDRLRPGEMPVGVEVVPEELAEGVIEGEFTVKEEPSPESEPEAEADPKEHWCKEHNCAYELKTSRYGSFYAHKIKGGWCNEKKKAEASTEETGQPEPQPAPEPSLEPIEGLDMDWLKESLKKVKFDEKTAATWITSHFGVEGGLLKDVLPKLTKEQLAEFVKEIQDRLEMA